MPDIATDAAAIAAAVTGSDTPANVKVSRPPAGAVWTIFAGLAAVSLMAVYLASIIAFHNWPEITAPARVKWLGWALIATVVCIPLLAFALASPWVGKVEASAGDNHLSMTGR